MPEITIVTKAACVAGLAPAYALLLELHELGPIAPEYRTKDDTTRRTSLNETTG
jgi:hypothetical protein